MRLLLHAITTPDSSDAGGAGLGGRRIVRVAASDVLAWASELDDSTEPFTRADLLEHHEIISRLHARVDACLPARFATWLTDPAALERQSGPLRTGLERVRGRSELAITSVWTSFVEAVAAPQAPTPGRQYLLARQHAFAGSEQRRLRAQQLADEMEALAGRELMEASRSVCPSRAIALSMALLVPSAGADQLKARLPRERPDVRILVNGPWPPYTFAAAVAEELGRP